ncbi:MAG: hypothetical protein ACLQGP_00800 [Isosphaeraceae bacterium]
MTAKPRQSEILSNPFFVILLGTSALFVLTVLAYLVSPSVLVPNPARQPRGAGSIAMAEWFDRHGPMALAVEFVVMLLTGVLAMATDPWFSSRSNSRRREGES